VSSSVTVIILTYNEELHIERCISSLRGFVERVCVVDSFSTDRTVEIANALGAEVVQRNWKNYASQFQFGIDHFEIESKWTMRIDADEYLEKSLVEELSHFISQTGEKNNSIYLQRKIVFMERPIVHGFFYPALMLRVWRTGQGRIEQRWMDEHIIVENPHSVTMTSGDLVDHNLNDLSWWISKHNGYATREVYDMVMMRESQSDMSMGMMSGQASRKRWVKERIYTRLPVLVRSTLYFIYRFFLGLGFLDGKEGFFFHFLQAYWYRTLVEAKMYELEKKAISKNVSVLDYLKEKDVY